jgi:hypothetical protein
MLTIIQTTEFVLPSGTVAATCPPALLQRGWSPAPKQPDGHVQTRISGIAPSWYAAGVAGAVESAERVAVPAAGDGGADLPNRPFYTMSRRDHRTWRPPH